eukprot:3847184-Pyramimonas_sp.AAC.1
MPAGAQIGSLRRNEPPNPAKTGAPRTDARQQSASEHRAISGLAVEDGSANPFVPRRAAAKII